jgi:hypothetical protein
MLIYFIVPALALLPAWLTRAATDGRPAPGATDRWRYSYIVAVIALIVFAGARVDVGTDYSFYESVFRQSDPEYAGSVLQNAPQEQGFTLLVLGLRTLSESPQILFLVSSVITVGCAAVAMRRMSVNFAVSLTLFILLGFYIAPFNILRQGLAISLNFLAYSYFDTNRRRWLVLNVVAQFLHATTVLAVLLQLVLRRVKPSWRMFGLMLLASAVLALFFGEIAPRLGFLDLLNGRYASYLEGEKSGIGTYLFALSRAALVGLLLVYRPKSGEIDRYIVLAMMGVCLLLLGTQAKEIGRLEFYFGIYLVVALPRAAREIPRRSRAIVVAVVVAGSIAFYFAYLSQFGNLVPYHFDWSLIGLPSAGPPP